VLVLFTLQIHEEKGFMISKKVKSNTSGKLKYVF
jgi:hypothetical protein